MDEFSFPSLGQKAMHLKIWLYIESLWEFIELQINALWCQYNNFALTLTQCNECKGVGSACSFHFDVGSFVFKAQLKTWGMNTINYVEDIREVCQIWNQNALKI